MKGAIVVVLISGIWDSGLRYNSYKECMITGVHGSFNKTLKQFIGNIVELDRVGDSVFIEEQLLERGLTEITIAKIIIGKRLDYQQVVRCLPVKL